MLFSSYSFIFCFLPLLVVLYFVLPVKFRNYLLLAASLGFYAWGGPKYLLVMLLSILINYCAGLAVNRFEGQNNALKWVIAGTVILNLGLLGYYKYTDFLIDNVNSLFGLEIPFKGIIMPIGISFYTFQGMSYVFDVKRKKGEVLKNPLDLALYISFFPQLIAGPIVRYETIAKQLHNRIYSSEKINYGIFRFVIGLSKKVLLANTIGELADYCFALRSGELNILTSWMGIIAYTLQIYFDFSGYSDMAIGLGKIFGFDFMENFNYPYIATSITNYWKRWHISMTKWFTDYVYIPLGGNRKGEARQYLNMLIVWALSGLWHGANWNFVIWGLYYAVILIIEKAVSKRRNLTIIPFFKHAYSLVLIMLGWVIFNSPNMTFAFNYIRTMFGFGTPVASVSTELSFFVHEYGVIVALGIIAATPLAKNVAVKLRSRMIKSGDGSDGDNGLLLTIKAVVMVALLVLCTMRLVVSSYNPFIYFRF